MTQTTNRAEVQREALGALDAEGVGVVSADAVRVPANTPPAIAPAARSPTAATVPRR